MILLHLLQSNIAPHVCGAYLNGKMALLSLDSSKEGLGLRNNVVLDTAMARYHMPILINVE